MALPLIWLMKMQFEVDCIYYDRVIKEKKEKEKYCV